MTYIPNSSVPGHFCGTGTVVLPCRGVDFLNEIDITHAEFWAVYEPEVVIYNL